ncbi:MAG: 30S ribosomal protein S8 [bacterium]|nr:30S ribosomal protein S8 [bacterium]
MHTDPIADLLTRLRNASLARQERTMMPSSRMKKEILRVMKQKEVIADFKESDGSAGQRQVTVSFFPGKNLHLKRVSKPGQRIYKKSNELFPVLRGYGFAIISTSQGVMTGDEARKKKLGGELICEIL